MARAENLAPQVQRLLDQWLGFRVAPHPGIGDSQAVLCNCEIETILARRAGDRVHRHGKRNKGLQEPHAEAAAELLRRLLAERTEL